MMVRVSIYDDNAPLRDSLVEFIQTDPGCIVVGSFQNALHAEEETLELFPDVILMDIDMPGISGIEGLKRIRKQNTEVNILMFTVFEDDKNVFEAIKAGANGYLLKKTSPDKILLAIHEANTGGAPMSPTIARQVLQYFIQRNSSTDSQYQLTSKEKEVLELLVNGYSYKAIALDKIISIDTVRSHIKNIYEKLHVNSKAEAVAKALKEKLL